MEQRLQRLIVSRTLALPAGFPLEEGTGVNSKISSFRWVELDLIFVRLVGLMIIVSVCQLIWKNSNFVGVPSNSEAGGGSTHFPLSGSRMHVGHISIAQYIPFAQNASLIHSLGQFNLKKLRKKCLFSKDFAERTPNSIYFAVFRFLFRLSQRALNC